MKSYPFKFISFVFSAIFCFSLSDAAEKVDVVKSLENGVQNGRIAFIKPTEAKLIEIDLKGKTTWEFQIPSRYMRGLLNLSSGADIEWLEKSDTFLVAIPSVGIIEVDRAKGVIWEFLTAKISHDVDMLDDGTIIFVNAWDDDDDYIVTQINRQGDVLNKYTAEEIGLSKNQRNSSNGNELYSNTHINAIQKIGQNKFLLSLRNYNQAVIIENGKIISTMVRANRIHDPFVDNNFIFFIRRESVEKSVVVKSNINTGKRVSLFVTPDSSWTPLRTLEKLKNGNFLLTGSSVIGQINTHGEVVWQVKMPDFQHQKLSKNRHKDFLYKAAFVYK